MENEKPILRGEFALMAAIVINSFSVVLMLYSGSGISAISSVPYAFSEVFKELSLGTWTYIFQGALVLSLMILRRKFVPSYLFSFVAGCRVNRKKDHRRYIRWIRTSWWWSFLWKGLYKSRPFCSLRSTLCSEEHCSSRIS